MHALAILLTTQAINSHKCLQNFQGIVKKHTIQKERPKKHNRSKARILYVRRNFKVLNFQANFGHTVMYIRKHGN